MESQYNYSLYEACEKVLYEAVLQIETTCEGQEIIDELYNFLNNDETIYEVIFSDLIAYDFSKDKRFYKNIMKLIIVSNCYQYAICELEKGKAEKEELDNLYFIEQEKPTYKQLLKIFQDPLHKSIAHSFIDDYLNFFEMTYIYQLDSMNIVLKTGRLSQLLEINPFAILQYLDMVEEDQFISSERAIQNFLDVYEKSGIKMIRQKNEDIEEEEMLESIFNFEDLSSFEFENYMAIFFEELRNLYDSDSALENDISYIIANVYENAKVFEKEDPISKKWVEFFEQEECDSTALVERFMYDPDFFEKIINFFVKYNENLFDGDLEYNRNEFKQKNGNIKILKKLNPFYEEEEVIYDAEKTVN